MDDESTIRRMFDEKIARESGTTATPSTVTAAERDPQWHIDEFWKMLDRCWEIEPREYFEREAPRNGFGSPLAMAVHYMWKREVKEAVAEKDSG